jgi:hypothetical protein
MHTSPPRKMMRCLRSRPKGSPDMSCVLQSVGGGGGRGTVKSGFWGL